MQISLIRHGPPAVPSNWIRARQLPEWIRVYEEADIEQNRPIPERTRRTIDGARCIVSSHVKRSVQSAALLTGSLSFLQSPLFREAAFLVPPAPSWVRMKPRAWLKISRTMWLMGFKGEESYEQARMRAKQAADVLIGYALCYQKVALIGHGYFNMMIAKELKQRGWIGPLLPDQSYWGCDVYRYNRVLAGTDAKVPLNFT